jgi:hypothetical protein
VLMRGQEKYGQVRVEDEGARLLHLQAVALDRFLTAIEPA